MSKHSRAAKKAFDNSAAELLSVSFEFLDLAKGEFFVHGLTSDHYEKLFVCIDSISNSTEAEIVEQRHDSLRPKSIFNKTGTYQGFPEFIKDKITDRLMGRAGDGDKVNAETQAKEIVRRAFEVCIGKNYGRIHGFVWNKKFYVVWFDPAHNLYPGKNDIKLHDAFSSVRSFGPETVNQLKDAHEQHCADSNDKIEKLNAQITALQDDLDELLAK